MSSFWKWSLRGLVTLVLCLVGAFIYQVWIELMNLDKESLALAALISFICLPVVALLSYKLGTSRAGVHIDGVRLGTNTAVGVYSHAKITQSKRGSDPGPVPSSYAPTITHRQLPAGDIVEGNIIEL